MNIRKCTCMCAFMCMHVCVYVFKYMYITRVYYKTNVRTMYAWIYVFLCMITLCAHCNKC